MMLACEQYLSFCAQGRLRAKCTVVNDDVASPLSCQKNFSLVLDRTKGKFSNLWGRIRVSVYRISCHICLGLVISLAGCASQSRAEDSARLVVAHWIAAMPYSEGERPTMT